MIFDLIENIPDYYGISPNLDIALEWLHKNEFSPIGEGTFEILE